MDRKLLHRWLHIQLHLGSHRLIVPLVIKPGLLEHEMNLIAPLLLKLLGWASIHSLLPTVVLYDNACDNTRAKLSENI